MTLEDTHVLIQVYVDLKTQDESLLNLNQFIGRNEVTHTVSFGKNKSLSMKIELTEILQDDNVSVY